MIHDRFQRTFASFNLVTDLGDFDLRGEIPGGNYETLQLFAENMRVAGLNCPVLGLEKLIEVKRAAGRPKDLEAVAELEVLLEESLEKEKSLEEKENL